MLIRGITVNLKLGIHSQISVNRVLVKVKNIEHNVFGLGEEAETDAKLKY